MNQNPVATVPRIAPSAPAVKMAKAATTDRQWTAFVKRYRAEMAAPDRGRVLDLLAALSRGSNFSVGCYCEDESRCHRSVLRSLLEERGARIA